MQVVLLYESMGKVMQIKIAIAEDNPRDREHICRITEEYLKKRQVPFDIRLYAGPMELLLDIDQGMYYDLFLLDVEMQVLNGIHTAREIRKRYLEPAIVYITDYVEYSIQAFEVNTFRYIPKKDVEERLPEALDLIWTKVSKEKSRCYVIRHYLDVEVIPHRDIYGIQKDGKYVVIYHRNGESRVRKSLQEVLGELHAEEFLEVGRGCAVNICHVLSIEKRNLKLRGGKVFPVGKYRIDLVKERIMEYWMGKQ